MATVKAVSSRASVSRVLDYVTKEEKTELRLMTGYDCSPGNVKGEMQATKELWGKADGRTYLHFVQSWHEDEKITPELAHRIGCELTKQLRAEGQPWHGFEVLMTTHVDRGHIHNHIVTNSVNMDDGKKIQFSPKDLQAMKDRSDELCRKYGLSICEKGKSFHGEDLTVEQPSTYSKEAQYIMDQAKAGNVDSYIMEIAKAAIEVRSMVTSREEFCQQMSDRGYTVNWSDTRKNITFTDVAREMHGERKCKVRDTNLEKTFPALQFSKESFILAFQQNAQKKELEQDHAAPELAAPGEPQQVIRLSSHDQEESIQQATESRQQATPEPEPERQRVYVPEPKTDSEQLKKALSDYKAAQAKDKEARSNHLAATKLPFWDKTKKVKMKKYRDEVRAAEREMLDAFSRIEKLGVKTNTGIYEMNAININSEDMEILIDRVNDRVKELQREESPQDRKPSSQANMEEAREIGRKMREEQQRQPQKQKKSKEKDIGD